VNKPLGHKAYGSIGHLPGSRMGTGDHHITLGQARICTEKVRDSKDFVVVQEKLDGSCCAVARLEDGSLVSLGRAGWPASTSQYEQHQLFAAWVRENFYRFDFLQPGERIVGEWLAQAHGTRYKLRHEPFVVFDIMVGSVRTPYSTFAERVIPHFVVPRLISAGNYPLSIEDTMRHLIAYPKHHGAIDPIEGAVWRVERNGVVDFLAKYVRPDKVDGCYLPEVSGKPAVWNWRPEKVAE
jgi:hypothetical protein